MGRLCKRICAVTVFMLIGLLLMPPTTALAEDDLIIEEPQLTLESPKSIYPKSKLIIPDTDEPEAVLVEGEPDCLKTQSSTESEVSLESLILSAIAERSIQPVDIESYGIHIDEFQDMYAAIVNAHPEMFDVRTGFGYSYWSDGTVISFTPNYLLNSFSDEEVLGFRDELARAIASVMEWVPADGTDLQKVKAVHDWLVTHVDYDFDEAENGGHGNYQGVNYGVVDESSTKFYPYCAYGALVKHLCVCQGYAGAFQMIMDMLGIPCTTVGAHDHAWNRVCIDGSWYHVDTTWDEDEGDHTSTLFFMKSDAAIQQQDIMYSGYYQDYGELTHADYESTEIPGTNTRYDNYTDSNWNQFWLQLQKLPQNTVTSVSLSANQLRLSKQEISSLDIRSMVPSNANPLMAYWSSSNVGIARVLPTGEVLAGSNAGQATIQCKVGDALASCAVIVTRSITEATVAQIAEQPYTGKALKPSVNVTLGSEVLVEGVDYEVSYANNTETGIAAVTITGIGAYDGSTAATFKIVKKTFADGWVDLGTSAKGYAKGGALVTGWMDLGSSKLWFGDDGHMATGWTDVELNGVTMHYYFNPVSGNLVRGTWFDIDGAKYYFRPSGNMATGWVTIINNGVEKKYYLDKDGQMLTGWQDIEVNGNTMRYYFRPSGAMATGWATVDGQKYWFRPSGNMATGFTDVDDAYKRYFDSLGHMLTGWQTIGSRIYYFRPSGAMQTGKATIAGMSYEFTASGTLQSGKPPALSAQDEGSLEATSRAEGDSVAPGPDEDVIELR